MLTLHRYHAGNLLTALGLSSLIMALFELIVTQTNLSVVFILIGLVSLGTAMGFYHDE